MAFFVQRKSLFIDNWAQRSVITTHLEGVKVDCKKMVESEKRFKVSESSMDVLSLNNLVCTLKAFIIAQVGMSVA